MRESVLALCGALLGCGLVCGCGAPVDTAPPAETEKPLQTNDELKTRLNEIAESGVAGSGIGGVQAGIEQLKSSNPKLAAELEGDLNQLRDAGNAGKQEQVKAIATRMAAKL